MVVFRCVFKIYCRYAGGLKKEEQEINVFVFDREGAVKAYLSRRIIFFLFGERNRMRYCSWGWFVWFMKDNLFCVFFGGCRKDYWKFYLFDFLNKVCTAANGRAYKSSLPKTLLLRMQNWKQEMFTSVDLKRIIFNLRLSEMVSIYNTFFNDCSTFISYFWLV